MAQKCRFSQAARPRSVRAISTRTVCMDLSRPLSTGHPMSHPMIRSQMRSLRRCALTSNATSSPLFVCFRCRFLMKKPDHDLICQARLGTRSQKETPATQHCFFSSLAGLAPWRCERVWDRPCCARREGEGSLLRRRARPRCGKQSDFPSCSVCGSAPAVGGLHNTPLHAALHVSFIHLHRRFVLLDGCRGRGA